MKVLLSMMLFVGSQVYGATYLYKWKAGNSPLKSEFSKVLPEDKFVAEIPENIADKLRLSAQFEYFEKDQKVDMPAVSFKDTKSNSNKNWVLDRVNVHQAWRVTKGSPNVIVGVCDSGIDRTNPEFKGKVLRGWNFVGNNSNTNHYLFDSGRPNTHGSMVASFIAAEYNEANGNGGVAPGVKILPGLINAGVSAYNSNIIKCIR